MQQLATKTWRMGPFMMVGVLALIQRGAIASGGQVCLRTDNSPDGYYYRISNTGLAYFETEYDISSDDCFDPDTIVCGARVYELNQGNPPYLTMRGSLRCEDVANPGYADLTLSGLIANYDTPDNPSCNTSVPPARQWTFNGGLGVPVSTLTCGSKIYLCANEPAWGPGNTDFCGLLLDTTGPVQGYSKFDRGDGTRGVVNANHFLELITYTPQCVDLRVRFSGSSRFPGDPGVKVVFADKPNSGATASDDAITAVLVIDNASGGVVQRDIDICLDRYVITGNHTYKQVTPAFRPIGGGGPLSNPVTLPQGRTILRLEVASPGSKEKARNAACNSLGPVNLTFKVLVDDPSNNPNACLLDNSFCVDDEQDTVGLRCRSGSADDGTAESYFRVNTVNLTGDALNVRFRAIRLPSVAYQITGLGVALGEFGGTGLPGLDALELRRADPLFPDCPDLVDVTGVNPIRTVGTRDGVGEVPGGPPQTDVVVDTQDFFVDPPNTPDSLETDYFVVGVLLPGDFGSGVGTGIGADATSETLLGESSYNSEGQQPCTYDVTNNFMLRFMVNGEQGTALTGGGITTNTKGPGGAICRVVGEFIPVDAEDLRKK